MWGYNTLADNKQEEGSYQHLTMLAPWARLPASRILSSVVYKLPSMRHCYNSLNWLRGFPVGASGKEPAWQCRRHKTCRFDPWIRKIPWRRAWQPILVFLPENPMDRGVWQAAVHSVAQNRTRMNQFSGHTCKLTKTVNIILIFFFCRAYSFSLWGDYFNKPTFIYFTRNLCMHVEI